MNSNELKKNETLDKLLGMKWKRNKNVSSPSNRNTTNIRTAEHYDDGKNQQRRSFSDDLSQFQFEVLIRETFPYCDEVPYSELSNADNVDFTYRRATANRSEEKYFFRNIHPKDENAFQFYRAKIIAAAYLEERKQPSFPEVKQTVSDNQWDISVRNNEQPRIAHLSFDLPNVNFHSEYEYSNTISFDGESTKLGPDPTDLKPNIAASEPGDYETFAHQGASAVSLATKRRPGIGIRLNRKPAETTSSNEPASFQQNVATDRQKNMNQDIDKILDHIDGERLNNLRKNTYQENYLERSPNEHFPETRFPVTDICTNVLLDTNIEQMAKENDVCFPSAALSTVPTAMVQPSVVTNEKGVIGQNTTEQVQEIRSVTNNGPIPTAFPIRLPEISAPVSHSYLNHEIGPFREIFENQQTPHDDNRSQNQRVLSWANATLQENRSEPSHPSSFERKNVTANENQMMHHLSQDFERATRMGSSSVMQSHNTMPAFTNRIEQQVCLSPVSSSNHELVSNQNHRTINSNGIVLEQLPLSQYDREIMHNRVPISSCGSFQHTGMGVNQERNHFSSAQPTNEPLSVPRPFYDSNNQTMKPPMLQTQQYYEPNTSTNSSNNLFPHNLNQAVSYSNSNY